MKNNTCSFYLEIHTESAFHFTRRAPFFHMLNIYLFIIYVAFYNNISIKVLLIVTREMYLEDPVEITVLEKVVRSYDFEDSRRAASFENNFFSEMSLFVPWFFIFISVEIF